MRRYSYLRTLLHCLLGTLSLWVRCFVIVAISSALIFCHVPVFAETDLPREYKIRVAFVYNFTKFIIWPESSSVPGNTNEFIVAVLGDVPHMPFLQEFVGKNRIMGKRVVIKQFFLPEEIGPCHLLFIPTSQERKIKNILERIRGKPVLTIGDTDGYAKQGVIINFYIEKNRIKFEINVEAAERAGLRISSELLKLARIVTE